MTGDLIDIELRQVMRDVNVPMGDSFVRIDRRPFLQYRKRGQDLPHGDGWFKQNWSDWTDVPIVEEKSGDEGKSGFGFAA